MTMPKEYEGLRVKLKNSEVQLARPKYLLEYIFLSIYSYRGSKNTLINVPAASHHFN